MVKAWELGDLDEVVDGEGDGGWGGDLERWRESVRGRADRILADLAGNIGFLQFFP